MRNQPHAQAEVARRVATVADQRRIPSHDVRHLCGGISDMTLWRWLKDRDFPAPVYIGKRRYWKEADVIEWLDRQSNTIAAE